MQIAHEGTGQHKEAKTGFVVREFEMFTISEDESMDEMSAGFTTMINGFISLGKRYSNLENIRKVFRCLPKAWRPKVTSIEST